MAYLARCTQVSSLLPSNRGRSALVHSLVSYLGLLRRDNSDYRLPLRVISPVPATAADLLSYHEKEYIGLLFDSIEGILTDSNQAYLSLEAVLRPAVDTAKQPTHTKLEELGLADVSEPP